MSAAVVLLSGGQDSTTCLYWALERFTRVHALTIGYGQRHASEIEAALEIGKIATTHVVYELPSLAALTGSALLDASTAITAIGGLDDDAAPSGLPTSYVPARNMIMLSLATAHACSVGAHAVVTGVCQTDYSGYPDCRAEFISALGRAASLALPGACRPIDILTPLMHLTKAQTVQLARSLGSDAWAALGRSVTCYEGQRPGCGGCPACALRARGFAEAGEEDPAHAP